ncbi:MAG: histidine kinase [Propionibacteriales bacterium]|nr:histidine kinase [Propionibacteriales bacterium]
MVVTEPASVAVETSLFRALAVFRAVVLAFAVGTNASRWREFEIVWLGWAVIAGMVLWTLVVTWAYDAPHRRNVRWLVADLLVAILALVSTPVIQSAEQLDASDATIPTFWVAASLLAWSLHWRWAGGLLAAAIFSVFDLAIRNEIDTTAIGNIFLLFLATGVVGYCVGLLMDAAQARSQAERLAAAAEERERIARDIHDGVLQVLALVQRRGQEIGGPAAELGQLAGEQEVALRQLVQRPPEPALGPSVDGESDVDLSSLLDALGSARVTVSTPGKPVWVSAHVGHQITAACRSALDNTTLHAGPAARSWLLLEEDGDQVVVSVRDDGSGIPDGRLDAADAEGRMGVSKSILGRVRGLGGDVGLTTAPGMGVDWELRIPRRVSG